MKSLSLRFSTSLWLWNSHLLFLPMNQMRWNNKPTGSIIISSSCNQHSRLMRQKMKTSAHENLLALFKVHKEKQVQEQELIHAVTKKSSNSSSSPKMTSLIHNSDSQRNSQSHQSNLPDLMIACAFCQDLYETVSLVRLPKHFCSLETDKYLQHKTTEYIRTSCNHLIKSIFSRQMVVVQLTSTLRLQCAYCWL